MSAAEQQVLQNEEKLLKAFKNNDVEILEELLHDDLIFIIPSGEIITKAKDIENMKSGNLQVSEIFSNNQNLSVIGDNIIVTVTLNISGSYLDQAIDNNFRYIRIWKQFGDQWKVIAGSGMGV